MAITVANYVLYAAGVYILCGVAFASYVVTGRLGKLHVDAGHAGFPVRIMIFPGLAILWPLLITRVFGRHAGRST